MFQAVRRGDFQHHQGDVNKHSYRKNGDPYNNYYNSGGGVIDEPVAYDDTADFDPNNLDGSKTTPSYTRQMRHSQFYAEEFYTGDDEIDEEFQGDESHLTPPCEEDEMIEEDYLVPSIMRNGNCYLAANYNEKASFANSGLTQSCNALSTVKKLAPNNNASYSQEYGQETSQTSMPMTPPSSSGSSCLLFIFVEHPQDPSALDKLTLPFEDSLTVMDMMVRVAASKRFVVSDYKAYQFDFDTLCYRLLKPHTTMDQLRHNCVHLFVRNSACVLDQATGNRDHHIYLTARLPIVSSNQYSDDDFTLHDCIIRKFWVPETVAVIELLFFICDRHGLNWREWELWLLVRQRFTAARPIAMPPQMIQLKNLNKLLSYSKMISASTPMMSVNQRETTNSMTIIVLPKGISSQRVEEMTDALMNDPQKKLKSGKIRRFFSRIFRFGKPRKEPPKRAVSTFDISENRSQNYPSMPPHFRSHHDLSIDMSSMPMPSHPEPKQRSVSQHGMLQEVKDTMKTPLPRINFHKKYRAPNPPSRTSGSKKKKEGTGHTVNGNVEVSTAVANSGKKRAAPKPALVTKISVPAAEFSDTSLQDNSVSAVPTGEISSIHASQNSSGVPSKPSTGPDAPAPPPHIHSARIIENPVYVRAGFETVTTETQESAGSLVQTVSHNRQEYAVVTSTSITPPRHVVSVSVLSEESTTGSKMDLSNDGNDGRQSVSSDNPSNNNVSSVISPPPSSKVQTDTEVSTTSSAASPSPMATSSVTADDPDRSTSPSMASLQRDESPVLNNSSNNSVKESSPPRVLSCTEVQLNTSEADLSGRSVIRIRSGYDISSVAKRTKVIGGGKVKETANRLSESTIVSGLKLMASSMNVGSTSSVSTAGTGGSNASSDKNDSRNCNTLPLMIISENASASKKQNSRLTAVPGEISDVSKPAAENDASAESDRSSGTGMEQKKSTSCQQASATDKQNGEAPGETKRASLFTPRPFVPAFTAAAISSNLAGTSIVPGDNNKPNNRMSATGNFATVEEENIQEQKQQQIPPPPPLPSVKKAAIKVSSLPPNVSVHSPSTMSTSSSSGCPIDPICISVSPSSISEKSPAMSSSSVASLPTANGLRRQQKPRPLSAKVESPREQILNAIRDGGTVARLKKVPPEEKRYISTVKTYVNGVHTTVEPIA